MVIQGACPRHSVYAISIYAYIDPQNHPNVGKYGSPMECLGVVLPPLVLNLEVHQRQ